MRNYTIGYFRGTNLHYHDDGPPPIDTDTQRWFMGQDQDQADSVAQAYVDASMAADPTHVTGYTFFEPQRYILLSSGLVSSYLVDLTTNTNTDALRVITNVDYIAQSFGMDSTISPKEQNVYPWNGRARRHFACNLDLHLAKGNL
jgi:hypothetical protein